MDAPETGLSAHIIPFLERLFLKRYRSFYLLQSWPTFTTILTEIDDGKKVHNFYIHPEAHSAAIHDYFGKRGAGED